MRYYTGSCEIKWRGDGEIGMSGDECPQDIIDWAKKEIVGVEDDEDVYCDVEYSYHAEEWEPADGLPDCQIEITIGGISINGFTCPKDIREDWEDVFKERIRQHLCEKHHLED